MFLCPWPGGDDNRGPSWPFFIMATASVVREKMIALLDPLIEQLGYELVDIEWVSEVQSTQVRSFGAAFAIVLVLAHGRLWT